MSPSDPIQPETASKLADSYRQLGLEPGASMREIEAAYWAFARELRGQSAMGPYTRAYEVLVNSVRPPQREAPAAPAAAPDAPQDDALTARPTSKFGWPER